MAKVTLTLKQVLEFVILGINNGNYQAAKNLAQDALDIINEKEEKEKSSNEK